ncbi:MAG: cysteine synthase A, partial [Rhodospirillales bacterium]|nr:cysteine synthase A [Rhodospirillales bacterium]
MSTPAAPRGKIYDSIIDTVGGTPLIKLDKLAKDQNCKANLLGKCEFFNPLNSVKDR